MKKLGQKKLSNGELSIMECIWKTDEPLTRTGILRKINEGNGTHLNIATLSSYLRRMIWKGYLVMKNAGGHSTYHALVRMEDYYQKIKDAE